MISYAEVAIGAGGVAGCRACERGSVATPFALAEITSALEGIPHRRTSERRLGVAFTGLDAFAHPDLPRVIDAAVSRGFDRVRVTSDGRFLDQGGNAFGAHAAGVTHLEISLLAGDAGTHDGLIGHQGVFEAAARGARQFLSAGADAIVSGRVPLCRHSLEHAPGAVAALAAMGAVAVHLDVAGLASHTRHVPVLDAALETATVNRIAAFVTGWEHSLPIEYTTAPWVVEPAR